MKHILLTAIVAALVALGVGKFSGVGAGATSATVKESAYERVMRTGTLRCAYNVWAPAVMVEPNTGKVSGIVPDVVELAAKGMGLKVEWVGQVSWSTFSEDLKAGRYDAMCAGAWELKELGPHVTFTRPLFFNPVYAYVRADDHRFDADLLVLNDPRYRVVGVDGAMSLTIAQMDFPKAKTVALPQLVGPAESLMNVVLNKADVVFCEPSTVAQFNQTNPDKLLRRLGDTPYRAFASPLLAAEIHEYPLVRMFDTALSELMLQGSVQRIVDSYEPDRSMFVPAARGF